MDKEIDKNPVGIEVFKTDDNDSLMILPDKTVILANLLKVLERLNTQPEASYQKVRTGQEEKDEAEFGSWSWTEIDWSWIKKINF